MFVAESSHSCNIYWMWNIIITFISILIHSYGSNLNLSDTLVTVNIFT